MKNIIILSFVLLCGCCSKPSDPSLEVLPVVPEITYPPLYSLGDTVSVRDSNTVGIITKVTYVKEYKWSYTVMFKHFSLDYDQKDLKLVERFNWNRALPEVRLEDNVLKEAK